MRWKPSSGLVPAAKSGRPRALATHTKRHMARIVTRPSRRGDERHAREHNADVVRSRMLKIYGFARVNKGARGNTRDLRVLWALEEMEMPYEIVGMDHPNHDLDSPSYRAINPF